MIGASVATISPLPASYNFHTITPNTTLTSLTKEKSLQLIEDRISILLYYKDIHYGKKPWLSSIPISKVHWQQLYSQRRGAKSFYSTGVSLATVMDRTFPTLKEYVFAVTTVLQFYDYVDTKKQPIPADKLPLSPNFDSSSLTTQTTPPTAKKKKFALNWSNNNNNNTPLTPTNSSAFDDSKTTFKGQVASLSNSQSPNLDESKFKLNINHQSPLSKNQAALNILNTLKTPSEDELSYIPDTFESVSTLIDALIIFLYNVSYQLRGRDLGFIELNEIEDNLKTIDELIRKSITGEIMKVLASNSNSAPQSPTTSTPDLTRSPEAQTQLCRDPENLEKQIIILLSSAS